MDNQDEIDGLLESAEHKDEAIQLLTESTSYILFYKDPDGLWGDIYSGTIAEIILNLELLRYRLIKQIEEE